MLRALVLLSSLFLLGVACVPSPLPPVTVEPLAREVSFIEDVKPVLDRRCVVCHSCYNAACQLKLSSYEGIERGGSKHPVYLSSRLRDQQPTRLFVDGTTPDDWRALDFHSVIESSAPSPANNATMLYLLEAKNQVPQPIGEYRAEAADLSCPADGKEVSSFLKKYPDRGMPFGFPRISSSEHAILSTWLSRGAAGPSASEQASLTSPGAAETDEIEKWETFLNRDDPKYAMTARYLYEHFFLAHVRFSQVDSKEFYRLVRSGSPAGEPIREIATVRPYDDPGTEGVYYRFRKVHSTIVHKTHMVVEFDDERLARYNELFIDSQWVGPPHRMAYQTKIDANPFVVYAQIPPRVRYEFMLDHSAYFIQSFMQGPVCKGQVALNVIHDHFWVMFLDPEADLTVNDPDFLIGQAENLRMPTEEGSNDRVIAALSDEYRKRYAEFYRAKTQLYDERLPDGQGVEAIWKGRRPEDGPLLTIYRHFDSASLHRGVLGGLPRTLWVIDYSQLERIYYSLVAGFDVFGNLTHQVSVRRYMDYLRMEGELNFIHFLPGEERWPTLTSWYLGDGAIEKAEGAREALGKRGTLVAYETDDPKREFVERIVDEHIPEAMEIDFDPINYRRTDEEVRMPESFETHEDVLDGLRALTAPGTGLIENLNGSDVNVLFVRFKDYDGADRFVSIVVNRWHDNVNSLFFEKKRLDPSKDSIDFFGGSIGSYPNYFLDVGKEDLPDFFDMLQNFDGSPAYIAKLDKYGVNRADERFWETYDWFQAQLFEEDPIRAGLYDLNRYHPEATAN